MLKNKICLAVGKREKNCRSWFFCGSDLQNCNEKEKNEFSARNSYEGHIRCENKINKLLSNRIFIFVKFILKSLNDGFLYFF